MFIVYVDEVFYEVRCLILVVTVTGLITSDFFRDYSYFGVEQGLLGCLSDICL